MGEACASRASGFLLCGWEGGERGSPILPGRLGAQVRQAGAGLALGGAREIPLAALLHGCDDALGRLFNSRLASWYQAP